MKKKITKMLSIVMISALAVTACSSGTTVTTGAGTSAGTTAVMTTTAMSTSAMTTTAMTTAAGTTTAGELELTLEELAKYDGQNGQPAYVAVDGIIYDVSNVEPWKGGKHNGFTAGKDLTNEIKTISPHGISKLALVPKVGKIKK